MRPKRPGIGARHTFVRKIAVLCLAALPAMAAANLDTLLKSVENRYNHAQSLRLNFSETYQAPRRPDRVESGTLALRKPGRMRWDYASPAGKVFVSDGKNLFLYTPDNNRVEHSTMKDTEDMRAPLAFLLGKLEFYREFRKFEARPDPGGTWIVAEPNSGNLPYSRVEFLVSPDARIQRLKVFGQDNSVLSYVFDQEKLNVPLDSKLFAFVPPRGAEIVEGSQ